jgi:small-conductance mechanosensitive channel
MLEKFLKFNFLDNEISDYLIAIITLGIGIIAIKILCNFILIRLKAWADKTANKLDDKVIRLFENHLIPLLYLGTIYISISNLNLHPIINRTIDALAVIIATFLGIRFVVSLAEYFLKLYWLTHRSDHVNLDRSINALLPAIRTVVWGVGIIFILDNLGFDISAVVASLGIGGVAIALASQGVLQDLFSYFAILFDRPFELGDFITLGEFMGSVEYVGIKTTRLKSVGGEEIIIANKDLTNSRIRNFKRMQTRRIVFTLSVTYQTNLEQLELIPSMVENIIKEIPVLVFERAHFVNYGDFSLNFEVVYFVKTSDYNQYMNAQQQINLRIKQEFDKHGIKFAYPTQIHYLYNSSEEKVGARD